MARLFIIVLSFLISFNSWSMNIRAIDPGDDTSPISDVGNGGDVVVCPKDDGTYSYEILDIYEGRERYGLSYDWPVGDDEYEVAQALLNRLQGVSLYRWKRITQWLNSFERERRLVNFDLEPIDDADLPFDIKDCEILQIARQEKHPVLGPRYLIDEDLYQRLDDRNKAALIIHEIMFREAIHFYGHTKSTATRATTAQLAANEYENITQEELYRRLYLHNYPEFEFHRILFRIPANNSLNFQPEFDHQGNIASLPCQVSSISGETSCSLVGSRSLEAVYGFSPRHYEDGVSSLYPFDPQVNYNILFGETHQPTNLAYFEEKEIEFKWGNYRAQVLMDVEQAHFFKRDSQGRPSQMKALMKLYGENNQLIYESEVFDKWRKALDVQFFYFGSETFIGLAGGWIEKSGTSVEICGFAKDVGEDKEVGDYPTLIHLGENKVDIVRICEGSSIVSGKLKLSIASTIDFGLHPVGGEALMSLSLSNVGQDSVQGIQFNISHPFKIKDRNSDSCKDTLEANESCTLTLAFEPLNTGIYRSQLFVSYHNGIETLSFSRDVEGVGTTPGSLTISESDPYDFGSYPIGSVSTRIFTLTNTGGSDVHSIKEDRFGEPFSFTGGRFPGTAGDCSEFLAVGASCIIEVQYSPINTGESFRTLQIEYHNGVGTYVVRRKMVGRGVSPALLTISDGPGNYSFGTVPTGSRAPHVFTVNNTGGTTATVMTGSGLSSPFQYSGGSYPGTHGTCGITLTPGGSCTITVEYAPRSVSGGDSDLILIDYSDGVVTQQSTRGVEGVAVSPAALTISEWDPYDFGATTVGGSSYHTFTITNVGSFQASSIKEMGLVAPFNFLGEHFPGVGGNCGSALNAGASCNIVVEFSPAATGTITDSIVIQYNNGVKTVSSERGVTGTGVSPAVLTISEIDPYDFGSTTIGSKATQLFVLTNTGSSTARSLSGHGLAESFSYSGGAFPGISGSCTGILNPGSLCTIEVEFSPRAAVVSNDTMEIKYDSGAGLYSTTRSVTGTGVIPAMLTITESDAYDFGLVATGGSLSHHFIIQNIGGQVAKGLSEVGLSSPFRFVGGVYPGVGGDCGSSLAPGAYCSIHIEFAPENIGAFSDAIDIFYNDGARSQNATRSIQGTGAAPAHLSFAGFFEYDFGRVEMSDKSEGILTLTNTGSISATSVDGRIHGDSFRYKGSQFPGTGGTCGSVLNAGSSCTVVVEFIPRSAKLMSGSTIIDYNDGVAGGAFTEQRLLGEGYSPSNQVAHR